MNTHEVPHGGMCTGCGQPREAGHVCRRPEVYAKPETLLGDLRGGLCSSGLCRQLRAVAANEIERLNKWADGFSDAQLKERATGEAYQQELRQEIERLRAEVKAAHDSERYAWKNTREIEAERQGILHQIQRHQPAGSPPPGDGEQLAMWVLDSQAAEIERLWGILRRIASSHGASDHSCFRRDLADRALVEASVSADVQRHE